jgi:predicted phage-related endonuclease
MGSGAADHREAAEQQLKRSEEASAAQLQSARQAAVTQAVQHSNQYQNDLERAAGQRKQVQRQVQELEAAVAGKESELASVQLQLAAALESSKRVQDNHGKVSTPGQQMQRVLSLAQHATIRKRCARALTLCAVQGT